MCKKLIKNRRKSENLGIKFSHKEPKQQQQKRRNRREMEE